MTNELKRPEVIRKKDTELESKPFGGGLGGF